MKIETKLHPTPRKSYTIPSGGHATFTKKPTKKMLQALNAMVELAKKMKL